MRIPLPKRTLVSTKQRHKSFATIFIHWPPAFSAKNSILYDTDSSMPSTTPATASFHYTNLHTREAPQVTIIRGGAATFLCSVTCCCMLYGRTVTRPMHRTRALPGVGYMSVQSFSRSVTSECPWRMPLSPRVYCTGVLRTLCDVTARPVGCTVTRASRRTTVQTPPARTARRGISPFSGWATWVATLSLDPSIARQSPRASLRLCFGTRPRGGLGTKFRTPFMVRCSTVSRVCLGAPRRLAWRAPPEPTSVVLLRLLQHLRRIRRGCFEARCCCLRA